MESSTLAAEVPWRTVLHQAAGPVSIVDLQGRLVYVNPALCRLLGYDAEHLLRRAPRDVTHPGDPMLDRQAIERMLAGSQRSAEVEKRLVRADGTVIWVLVTSSLIRHRDGRPVFLLCQIQEITARKESELLWRRTLAHAPIGMALLDMRTHFVEVNGRFCEMVGYPREELVGRRVIDLIYHGYRRQVEELNAELREGRADTGSVDVCLRHHDGHPFWMLARVSVVRGVQERPVYMVGQYEALGDDGRVSEERLAELTRMALHDPLTGLANRALLIDRFQHELAELGERGGVLSVFLVDLDRFKEINDGYGHQAGDQVLQAAARELQGSVRPSDTVARTGGDEFVVLASVADDSEAEALHARITDRLNRTATAGGHRIDLAASVGLATTRSASAASRDLLAGADRDMYARKQRSG
ncbi:PAS domain S-box protein [Saccharopolyspora erythraea]|uniref:sensor domain-containing diguanylate cyclase n=1 Tax=Saccharopolyspora erythraea TaxID=1836 RepID=UPI001BA837D6|nr:sensor domain-containing diguanylate cyclase [Saccharopolyspora erythraea]QUH02289.1 PAS domain S-box protein [Saccharopolyspora erythraea]